MNVRIGIIQTGKEIDIDLGDDVKIDDVKKDINKQLTGDTFWLTDKKGRTIGAPVDKIAFVEIGAESGENRIGFVG